MKFCQLKRSIMQCIRRKIVNESNESVSEHVERIQRQQDETYGPELVRDIKYLDEAAFLKLEKISVYVCGPVMGRRFEARTAGDLYVKVTNLIKDWERANYVDSPFVQPLRNQGFYLTYNGKPLAKRNIPLCDYNVKAGARIDLHLGGLLGGSWEDQLRDQDIDEEAIQRIMASMCYEEPIKVQLICVGNNGYQERHEVYARTTADLYTRVLELQLEADFEGRDPVFRTGLCDPQPTLYYGLKALPDRVMNLMPYGIKENDYIRVHYHRGLGGSSMPTLRKLCQKTQDFTGVDMNMVSSIVAIVGGVVSRKEVIDLAELFYIAKNQAHKCENIHDYIMLFMSVYRMYFGTSILNTLLDKINEFEVSLQSEEVDDFEQMLKDARRMMDRAEAIDQHPLLLKTHKLFSFMLVKGMLVKFGFDMTSDDYSRLDRLNLCRDYSSSKDFIKCVLDTTIYVIERIYVWKKTGSLGRALNNQDNYTKWFSEVDQLIALAPFTSNLSAHGTDYHTFLKRLDIAIEDGDNYVKFSAANSEWSRTLFAKKLANVKMIKSSELTKRASLKERMSPFGVLIHAGSSVAKSSFSKMLYAYYASLFELNNDDDNRYVRCPASEFWDNFASSMWCIHFDDIAAFNPAKLSDVDPTVKEILNVINNVAYVPPQADLSDKGKTPILAHLVTATTNTPHLNANEYFCCELAVRRRFPFVVTLRPKDDYVHENGRFIDPAKIPETKFYPDLWKIVVQKLVPHMECGKERARLEDEREFEDINEFLQYFGKRAKEHYAQQCKAMRADQCMMKINVCKGCLAPEHACTCEAYDQSEEVVDGIPIAEEVDSLTADDFVEGLSDVTYLVEHNIVLQTLREKVANSYNYCKNSILYCFLQKPEMLNWTMWILSYPIGRWVASFCVKGAAIEYQISLVAKINEVMSNISKTDVLKKGLLVLQVISLLYGAYYMISNNNAPKTKSRFRRKVTQTVTEEYQVRSKDPGYESENEGWDMDDYAPSQPLIQGNEVSTPVEANHPFEVEDGKDVWWKEDIQLSQFDVPIASRSMTNWSAEQFREVVGKNCVVIAVKDVDRKKWVRMRGIMIKGQVCLTVHHLFRTVLHKNTVDVKIICSKVEEGITPNHEFTLSIDSLFLDEIKEIAAFSIPNMPPFRDITKFWMLNRWMSAHEGFELNRSLEGDVCIAHSYALEDTDYTGTLNYSQECWVGRSTELTKQGDCGSMFVVNTPRGPIIGGMHIAGQDFMSLVLKVDKDQIDEILVQPQFNRMPMIQGGGAPLLSSEENKFEIGPLHHKSVFRYLENGTANVYGTMSGSRPRPKSHVCGTPKQRLVLEHFNTPLKYGAPVMSGWKVWRKNIEPVVTMTHNYDAKVQEAVTDAFVADVTEKLPKNWKSQLVILSDMQAVNGICGVMFIDRMKTSSSMGHPWRCSKQRYLIAKPSEEFPDGVDFPEEIWDRVRHIERQYRNGFRAFPIFTEHLKDEARSISKIKEEKTRGFSGGPVDFMIVMRKYLLPFIRLMQKNKFVFEAAVGTVVQSYEWTQIHKYLNSFGTDQKIAGDFQYFDKRMKAHDILCAGRFIIDIHRQANWAESDLLILSGIFYDIAFHVKNFNGDIVMVNGDNPSGHALTVIVNCIVNSSYMRYSFCILHPKYNVSLKNNQLVSLIREFKRNVRLFTYGDDNIQDVRNTVPWYNHTSISEALASIGIVYTMADKTAKSIPYIPMSECSFLKRTWVFNSELEAYMAPLEEESIVKSMSIWLPSRTISKHKQFVEVCSSACLEFWFYGEERFNREREFLIRITSDEPYVYFVKENTFPTYRELSDRFVRASKKMSKNKPLDNLVIQGEEIPLEDHCIIHWYARRQSVNGDIPIIDCTRTEEFMESMAWSMIASVLCGLFWSVYLWLVFVFWVFSRKPVQGRGVTIKYRSDMKYYLRAYKRLIRAVEVTFWYVIVHRALWQFDPQFIVFLYLIPFVRIVRRFFL